MTLINPQSTRFKDMTHSSTQYDKIVSSRLKQTIHSTRAKATKVSSTVEGNR